jgi:ABC-type phosphate transport system substrate-binding protein
MRTMKKLIAAASVVAAASALAMAPALADPITGSGKPVLPRATDIVGVGSDTIQNVFDQFSLDYNRTLTKASTPRLYSWDALNPKTGLTDMITAKAGCAKAPRPNGSSAGILGSTGGPLGLTANTKTKTKTFCTDFARSSRARATGDPAAGPGGIQFLAFAKDAVTYATNSTTNAPANLTTAQLASIYTCAVSNWKQVGGKSAPINAQLPQTGSGTRKFFLTALGGGTPITPGPCVNASPGEQTGGGVNFPEENEGVNKFLQGPNVIYPYSIGKFIAEVFHSAKCLNAHCTPVKGVVCKPSKTQNRFGCDTHGKMVLRSINGTKPTVGTGAKQTINPKFSAAFVRFVFVVVRWTKGTPLNIPKNLQAVFGPKGFICTSKTAHADLIDYGFLSLGKSCQ